MPESPKRYTDGPESHAGNRSAGHSDDHTIENSPLRRKGEEELARFFAHSADLLCIAGLDGYFKRLSTAWTSNFGWTLDEFADRPFIEFVHPDDRSATLKEVSRLRDGRETVLFENRYRHKNGSYRWLQWNASSDPGGSRIHATARDVTRRREIETMALEIADQEREGISRDLHDGLCQTLAGISALSSRLSKDLATTGAANAASNSTEITRLLKTAMSEARDLSRGLGTSGLAELGLVGALEALAQNLERMFAIQCTFKCFSDFPALTKSREMHLFRVAQQAVQNAVEHGRATHIEITLEANRPTATMRVLDDGLGITGDLSNSGGIGMHTMNHRAGVIGGSIQLQPRTPKGAELICEFSLQEPGDPGIPAVTQQ